MASEMPSSVSEQPGVGACTDVCAGLVVKSVYRCSCKPRSKQSTPKPKHAGRPVVWTLSPVHRRMAALKASGAACQDTYDAAVRGRCAVDPSFLPPSTALLSTQCRVPTSLLRTSPRRALLPPIYVALSDRRHGRRRSPHDEGVAADTVQHHRRCERTLGHPRECAWSWKLLVAKHETHTSRG